MGPRPSFWKPSLTRYRSKSRPSHRPQRRWWSRPTSAGPPHKVLDIAILGEGYTLEEFETFKTDLKRATEVFLGHAPFIAHRSQISVRGVMVPSPESGCDEPTRNAFRSTPLGATFNSLGSERYMLTEDNRAVRDIAANVPYDALVIMVNHDRYGGGGIYNLFCTFTAHSDWADYLLLHEFGHSFAGLADEYYSSSVAYNDFYPRGHEPEEANITALLDPDKLKWRDLVDPGTELPTPWEKEAYDREDAAYQEERKLLNETIAEASTPAPLPRRSQSSKTTRLVTPPSTPNGRRSISPEAVGSERLALSRAPAIRPLGSTDRLSTA